MRRSLAIAIITAVAVAPIIALYPPPAAINPADQIAQHVSTIKWDPGERWFGGFSGFELTPDGQRFYAVSDRGYLVHGTVTRAGQNITGLEITSAGPLIDSDGEILRDLRTDAEGLALDAAGRLYVSFEHAQRILRYDTLDSRASWPSYAPAWRALRANGGLEMVAVSPAGALFTIPEGVSRGAYEALVYRRMPGKDWEQPFTLPLTEEFSVVGGDFAQDGRLYILERKFTPYGFQNQIRRMNVTPTGVADIEIILQTPVRRHGNLEGLAAWTDTSGATRLTMVSDNNYLTFIDTQITEYSFTD
ncbi:hypothetical protein ROLI_043310 [Roseobacter fucihabitans]|uniref:Phytase-like domain-containing protein n=1 Tax=Roseobacter fucihabitans TaxID=1537242 RepID=A0ABZ2BYS0_9RHOB|nr:esterase-like activity of phytase family protein [Roseobacter litoralis]MBC6963810.1 hypothetical protein [Roseobacter litoralis]MBC6964105.1 hypothetical protein [Roseobacter litoralis]